MLKELCKIIYYEPLYNSENLVIHKLEIYPNITKEMMNQEIFHCKKLLDLNIGKIIKRSSCINKLESEFVSSKGNKIGVVDNEIKYYVNYRRLFKRYTPDALACYKNDVKAKYDELYSCAYGILLLKHTDFPENTNRDCNDFNEMAEIGIDFCEHSK
ncbi:MAG: hypothetical protein K6L73_07405 [Cellvibrionaceae bacterium]